MGREYTAMTRAGRHRRAGARAPTRTAPTTRRARRAVLRDGAGRRDAPTARPRSSRRSAPSAPPRIAGGWSTCWPRCTPSTRHAVGLGEFGRPAGLPGAAGAPLGQAARGLARPASTARRRRAAPPADRAACPAEDPSVRRDRARRLPARQLPGRRRRPDPRGRRLGDGHPRRHPHRRRAAAGLRHASARSPAATSSPTSPRRPGYPATTSSSRAYAAASGREPRRHGLPPRPWPTSSSP